MLGWIIGAAVVYLCVCPPSWDPAIRWKEVQTGIRPSFFGKADYK